MKYRETKEDIDNSGYLQPKLYFGEFEASNLRALATTLIEEFASLKGQFPKLQSVDFHVYEFILSLYGKPVSERNFWRQVLELNDGIDLLSKFLCALWDCLEGNKWLFGQQLDYDPTSAAAGLVPIEEAINSLNGAKEAVAFFPVFWRFLNEVVDMDHETYEDACIQKMLRLIDVGPRLQNETFMRLLKFRMFEGQNYFSVQEHDFHDRYIGPFESMDLVTMPAIIEALRDDEDSHHQIPNLIRSMYGREYEDVSQELLGILEGQGYIFHSDERSGKLFYNDRFSIAPHRDKMVREAKAPLFTGYHTYNPNTKTWTLMEANRH